MYILSSLFQFLLPSSVFVIPALRSLRQEAWGFETARPYLRNNQWTKPLNSSHWASLFCLGSMHPTLLISPIDIPLFPEKRFGFAFLHFEVPRQELAQFVASFCKSGFTGTQPHVYVYRLSVLLLYGRGQPQWFWQRPHDSQSSNCLLSGSWWNCFSTPVLMTDNCSCQSSTYSSTSTLLYLSWKNRLSPSHSAVSLTCRLPRGGKNRGRHGAPASSWPLAFSYSCYLTSNTEAWELPVALSSNWTPRTAPWCCLSLGTHLPLPSWGRHCPP